MKKKNSAKKLVKILDMVLKIEANSTSCLFAYQPKAPISLDKYRKLK